MKKTLDGFKIADRGNFGSNPALGAAKNPELDALVDDFEAPAFHAVGQSSLRSNHSCQ